MKLLPSPVSAGSAVASRALGGREVLGGSGGALGRGFRQSPDASRGFLSSKLPHGLYKGTPLLK